MEIKKEQGLYPSFCPISAMIWLSERVDDTFFIILGTDTCSHFVTISANPSRFPKSEFASLIIEQKDISMGNYQEQIINSITRLKPLLQDKHVFLMNTCASHILQIDTGEIIHAMNQMEIDTYNVSTNGLGFAYTEGEDLLIKSYLQNKTIDSSSPKVIFLGIIEDEFRQEIKRIMDELEIPHVLLPDFKENMSVSQKDYVVSLHPYLHSSINYLQGKGLKIIDTVFPLGEILSKEFYSDIARQFGKTFDHKADFVCLEGVNSKNFFLMGDNMYEPAIALFLARNGANIIEVGTPLVSLSMKRTMELLNDYEFDFVEFPNSLDQIKRIFQNKNVDTVICPNEYAYILTRKGINNIWSLRFFNGNIYGFAGTRNLYSIFSNSQKSMPYEVRKGLRKDFGSFLQ